MGRALLVTGVVACALGCGGADESTPVDVPSGCAPGEWTREDGSCIPAGLPPDMPCPPANWLHEDGSCVPAGVPPGGCGEGFVHDDRGCEPILPPEPCPPGLMTVPGETRCREVAPCAAGKWGDIPVEPDTEYVDISYAGMDSDGSALKPWTSIQAGVDAVAPRALVAVAAGSYLEDVTVTGKAVRLWGVCPALVELVGSGAELAALVVLAGADGSEVRGLALRGDANGFGLSGSRDVVLDGVWLHDNAERGVDAENALGATSVLLRGVLVEENSQVGVFSAGSEVTIEAGVVRTTQPDAQGSRGISLQPDPVVGAPATLVLRHSLVEQNDEMGIAVLASSATLEASVVRFMTTQMVGGGGVIVSAHATTGAPATLLLQRSVVEQNQGFGIFLQGSHASVVASVVRATLPNAQGLSGRGVNVQPHRTMGTPATLLLQHSLVELNQEVGVFVAASEATIDGSVVRHTLPDAQGLFGRGISAQEHPTTGASATLRMESSLIEHNADTGVYVSASNASVKNNVVRHTQSNALGIFGHAVTVQGSLTTGAASTLLLQSSLLEDSREVGLLVFGSEATIESCVVRDTLPNPAGGFGEGIAVGSLPGPASVRIVATHIDRSALAAVAAWGAHAALGGSLLTCHAFDVNHEPNDGIVARLEDLGGNLCGCPQATAPCKAVSANLEPPSELEPAPE